MNRPRSRRKLPLVARATIVELGRAASRAARGVGDAPLLAVLATTILAITLAVVGVMLALALQAARVASAVTPPDQVNVYLTKPVTGAERTRLVAAVEHVAGVRRARYVGPEDALEELADSLPDVRGWIAALGENPLPPTIVASVDAPSGLGPTADAALVSALSEIPGIAEVQTADEVVGRLLPVLRSIRWTAIGIAGALVVSMLFVVVATLRLTLEARRDEIEILRLHGATERWIRAPLWMEGAVLGTIAGFGSANLTWLLGERLGPIEVPALITGRVAWSALDLISSDASVTLLVLGPIVGGLGAAVATRWALGRS